MKGCGIAFLLPHFRPSGGVKIYLAIATELARRGYPIVLAACEPDGALRANVPSTIEIVDLPASSTWRARLAPLRLEWRSALPFLPPVILEPKLHPALLRVDALANFLASHAPYSLYPGGPHENAAAWLAKRLSGAGTRLVFSEHNTLSREHTYGRGRHRLALPPMVRLTYATADAVVAVSSALADHVAAHHGLPRSTIQVIYNPAVPDDLARRAAVPLDHPWFAPGAPPVVLGAGRLTTAKDFATLVRAFALVRKQRDARLIIIGCAKTEKKTVKRHAELTALARQLGITDDIALPGFTANPYAYMARAAVFALSSRQEGLPTVLIEALACGCPCVATDCPSGPSEILDQGRYGRLVPVGDATAMADAIVQTLDAPPDRAHLEAAAERFAIGPAIDAYETLLAPSIPSRDPNLVSSGCPA
ncbi:MAG: glycosyltransferase [Candidatus Competibacteraceae bacterium]